MDVEEALSRAAALAAASPRGGNRRDRPCALPAARWCASAAAADDPQDMPRTREWRPAASERRWSGASGSASRSEKAGRRCHRPVGHRQQQDRVPDRGHAQVGGQAGSRTGAGGRRAADARAEGGRRGRAGRGGAGRARGALRRRSGRRAWGWRRCSCPWRAADAKSRTFTANTEIEGRRGRQCRHRAPDGGRAHACGARRAHAPAHELHLLSAGRRYRHRRAARPGGQNARRGPARGDRRRGAAAQPAAGDRAGLPVGGRASCPRPMPADLRRQPRRSGSSAWSRSTSVQAQPPWRPSRRGHLLSTDVVPVGGNHATLDLAHALSAPAYEAERIKKDYGTLARVAPDDHELVSYVLAGEDAPVRGEIAQGRGAGHRSRPDAASLRSYCRSHRAFAALPRSSCSAWC